MVRATTLRLLPLLLILLLAAAPVGAQDDEPPVLPLPGATVNPDANISFPPPVTVVRGDLTVRGSANLPDMVNYFVEYRPLNTDLTPAVESPWLPIILPSTERVSNGVLGVWDSTVAPDGLYELRLTLNTTSAPPQSFIVRPVRIENNPSPFVQLPPQNQQPQLIPTLTVPGGGGLIPTLTLPPQPAQLIPSLTPPPAAQPADPPTPTPILTPTEDTTPRAIVTVPRANIRAGDDASFEIIDGVSQGDVLPIIGVSNRNFGWYLVDLPNGRRGWIGSGVIELRGAVGTLPRVQPPPLPPTPTPTRPPATATPVTQANLVAGIVVFDPSQPRCGETFNVGFDVANLGSTPTSASGVVTLQDVSNGAVRASTIGGFPVLQPGQTFRVNMPLTVNADEDERHTITLVIDPNNEIPETNEADNRQGVSYRLNESDEC